MILHKNRVKFLEDWFGTPRWLPCCQVKLLKDSNFILFDFTDSIEANVDSAAVHVEDANVQLQKASHYQVLSFQEFFGRYLHYRHAVQCM